jgi:hypothetical protein
MTEKPGWRRHFFLIVACLALSWLLNLPTWHGGINHQLGMPVVMVIFYAMGYLPGLLNARQKIAFLTVGLVATMVLFPLVKDYLSLIAALFTSVALHPPPPVLPRLTARQAWHVLTSTEGEQDARFALFMKNRGYQM